MQVLTIKKTKMNFKNIFILTICFATVFLKKAKCQTTNSFDKMTYFFVDNSSGYQADALSTEMVDDIKETLKSIALKNDNYFFFYGCNGKEQKASFEIKSLNTGTTLKSYLYKESKESEYSYDLQTLRENISEYPVRIKQTLDIYLYLSAYSIKRMLKSPDELPPALIFTRELPIYISEKDLEVKVKLYISKDTSTQFGEKTITDFFNFCNQDINLKSFQFQLIQL